ncbi:MAG: dethiobiotin synthase, partial [Pseudomonadales bacterium]
MTRTIFVTGTDTGIGKTRVAAALLHALVARGFRCAAFKPVAAGADAIDSESGAPRNSDALILQREASAGQSYAQVNPVLLEAPIAPHIAAAKSGINITVGDLQQAAIDTQATCDYLVVEGAGGWLV